MQFTVCSDLIITGEVYNSSESAPCHTQSHVSYGDLFMSRYEKKLLDVFYI